MSETSREPERVASLAEAIRTAAGQSAEATLGIVLGSGLSAVASAIESATQVPFESLEAMPRASVPGHAGRFTFGTIEGVRVACMMGRVHAYEGHDAHAVTRGARALALLGARTFVLTNAAGGIREDLEPGDVMAITDHLNLTGLDPGVGLSDGPLGVRFPSLDGAWDASHLARLTTVAERRGIALARGVYASRLGPSYETAAEVRMLRSMGADAVGMSTALEAIALRRVGVSMLGLSCITNRAAGREGAVLDHLDVQANAERMSGAVGALITGFAKELAS